MDGPGRTVRDALRGDTPQGVELQDEVGLHQGVELRQGAVPRSGLHQAGELQDEVGLHQGVELRQGGGDGQLRDPLGWYSVAATAAHDLRAPLHALHLLARQVCDGEADPVEFAHHVAQAAARMRATLDSLLDVVDLGRASVDPVEVDLTALLESVTADLAPLLRQHHARVEAEDLPTWSVDVVLIRRALMNLVHNAVVHAGVSRPLVRVEAAVVRDCLCLDVIDNGVGIPGGAGNADALFEPFTGLERDPDDLDADGVGAGMGLAICRGVAERHGGTITVPRTGPEGTTFRMVLPRTSGSEDGRCVARGEPGRTRG